MDTTQPFRPFTTLPRRPNDLSFEEREQFILSLPDGIAGVLRQFRSQMLDSGRLACTDPERYRLFRKSVFDTYDRLENLLTQWFRFYGILDNTGQMPDWLVEGLCEECPTENR